jgi:hypothetical protein
MGERWNIPPPVSFHRKARSPNYGIHAPTGPNLASDVSFAPSGMGQDLCIAADEASITYDTMLADLMKPIAIGLTLQCSTL